MNSSTQLSNKNDIIIDKALNYSTSLLNIYKFIEITKFDIDKFIIDKFWYNLNNDKSIYVNKDILEWMGYVGPQNYKKKSFIKLLKKHNIDYSNYEINDKLYDEYPEVKKDIENLDKGQIRKYKPLLINTTDFKKIILSINTKNSDKVKNYYIRLEELMIMYLKYTSLYNKRLDEVKIDSLEKTLKEIKLQNERLEKYAVENEKRAVENEKKAVELTDTVRHIKYQNDTLLNKLNVSKEDRVPKTLRNSTRESFVIFKKNNDDVYQYYTIRGQNSYINKIVKEYKNTLYKDLKIILNITYQPNSKNLYLRFKDIVKINDKLSYKYKYKGNEISCDIKFEKDLIDLFKLLNDDKNKI